MLNNANFKRWCLPKAHTHSKTGCNEKCSGKVLQFTSVHRCLVSLSGRWLGCTWALNLFMPKLAIINKRLRPIHTSLDCPFGGSLLNETERPTRAIACCVALQCSSSPLVQGDFGCHCTAHFVFSSAGLFGLKMKPLHYLPTKSTAKHPICSDGKKFNLLSYLRLLQFVDT